MSHWRIHTLAYPVPQVFDAAVDAASHLGFGISQVDRASLHLYLTHPGRFGGRGWPLELAVTDSGLGTTIVRLSWEQTKDVASWPGNQGRRAGRLCNHMQMLLAGGAPD